MLGAGIPLLSGNQIPAILKLAAHKVYPKTGTVSLEYEVA